MPLTMARPGEPVTVRRLAGAGARQRLAELGLAVGSRVTVVCWLGGSLILEVKGVRLALDRSLAMTIFV